MRCQPYVITVLAAFVCVVAGCDRGPATPSEAATKIAARIDEKDLRAADGILREALVRWPEDPRLRELQGDLDLERNFGTRAQAAFERAIRSAPGNRSLHAKLARSLLVQERYKEVVSVATPLPGDPDDVQGRLRLIRLEAELELKSRDFASARDEAEALWRLAARGTGTETLRTRLDEAAAEFEPVEAGRQHAQCRAATQPARPAGPGAVTGRVLRVGPGEPLATPAAAASAAVDGDVIEIGPGTHDDGPVAWKQDRLTIRGGRERPRVRITGAASGDAWTFFGKDAVVANLELEGGGIRLEAAGLTVTGSVVRANRAITAGDGASGDVLVSGSELEASASAVSVGALGRLTIEFSYVHGGGTVTSRARVTSIDYNRITAPGGPLLHLPSGGSVEIVGNELATDGTTAVGSSRVDLQACKLEYSIVSPK